MSSLWLILPTFLCLTFTWALAEQTLEAASFADRYSAGLFGTATVLGLFCTIICGLGIFLL